VRASGSESESPHLLSDQSLSGPILVKAVDNAGNETVATLHPSLIPDDEEKEEAGSLQVSYVILGGFLIGSLFLAVLKKRRGRRFEDPAVFF
jgi:hypothetical protein